MANHSEMTPTEAAAYLGVTRVTVYRMIEDGRLVAKRVSERKQYIEMESFDYLIGAPGRTPLLENVANWLLEVSRPVSAVRLRMMIKQRMNWHVELLRIYDMAVRDELPGHIVYGLNELLGLTPQI